MAEETSITAKDSEQVRQLHAKYAHAADLGRFDEFIECWTEDGVFEVPGIGVFKGREDIRKMMQGFRSNLEGTQQRHVVVNPSFTLQPDGSGAGYATLLWYMTKDGTTTLAQIGAYDDELRRVDDSWLFARRVASFD